MSESEGVQKNEAHAPIGKREINFPGHPTHPIALAIEKYIHAARDVKFAVRTFMPVAQDFESRGRKRVGELFDEAGELMKSGDPGQRIHGAKLALQAIRSAARHR